LIGGLVLANKIGNKNNKVLQKIRKLHLSRELFIQAIKILYVQVSLSVFQLQSPYGMPR
jgi:hypothetical protein